MKKIIGRQKNIEATHLTNGGMLTEILKELAQSGFIGIYNSHGKKSRESLYRLTVMPAHRSI